MVIKSVREVVVKLTRLSAPVFEESWLAPSATQLLFCDSLQICSEDDDLGVAIEVDHAVTGLVGFEWQIITSSPNETLSDLFLIQYREGDHWNDLRVNYVSSVWNANDDKTTIQFRVVAVQ